MANVNNKSELYVTKYCKSKYVKVLLKRFHLYSNTRGRKRRKKLELHEIRPKIDAEEEEVKSV